MRTLHKYFFLFASLLAKVGRQAPLPMDHFHVNPRPVSIWTYLAISNSIKLFFWHHSWISINDQELDDTRGGFTFGSCNLIKNYLNISTVIFIMLIQ